jgi:hypothetical protein
VKADIEKGEKKSLKFVQLHEREREWRIFAVNRGRPSF